MNLCSCVDKITLLQRVPQELGGYRFQTALSHGCRETFEQVEQQT